MNASVEIESSSSRTHAHLPNLPALAGFLEIAFDAAVAFDARERITYWNPAAEQMYGWTAQEALGKTPAKLYWPVNTSEEKKDRRQRHAALKRGKVLRGEQGTCRKDGSSLRVQYVLRAVFDADGKLTGYLAVYRHLASREQTGRGPAADGKTGEALRARTEEIETLLEVSPVAIFVAQDPECVRITANPAGYRLMKLPEDSELNVSQSAPVPEQPSYHTFRNGVEVPAEDLPMQKAARLGVNINEDELELRFKDGTQKFIYAFAKPLFDAHGKSRGAIATMLDVTDFKRAEQHLERNNQKLNDILASIQDDFYVLDHDWNFIFTSRSFTARIGKEPEDFLGNNIWQMFPKHLGTTLEENFRAAMEKGEIRNFEIPGKYTHAWYRMTAFPSAEGITVLGTDITERKRAEEEVQASRQMLETVVDYMPAAVCLIRGNDLQLQLANPAYQAIAPGKDMLGRTLDEIWPETQADFTAICRRVLETGEPHHAEDEFFMIRRQPDGPLEPVYFSWSLYRVHLPGNGGWGLLNTAWETTERKQAEQTLARQSELLQRVFENIPVLLVMWDPHLRKFTLNRHAETVLGWLTADANRGDFMSMTYPDPAYREMVGNYMRSLASGFQELVNVAKNGEQIPIEWANIRLADDTMVGIGVDLREHKRAEEALRENQRQLQLLNETLEQQVHEKTAEVRHLASDLIKAVQRERNRLSHILHDDLQQRVYAIRIQLTFLRDHLPGENEAAQQEVADIESQLDEILKTTRNLSIDLSPPILRDEGLSQAIHWLAVQMRQRYGLPIELQANQTFAIPDEELHVLLFNCVRELLFNVVKHAEASRAVVALQWSDANLQIEVRDDGKGFVPSASAQPLEEELRDSEDLRSSSGLPTIRYQLSLFGGHMEIQSEPGAGTQVSLIVPIAEEE